MPGHATLTAPSVQTLATYLAARRSALGPELGRLRRREVAAALRCSERTIARALALLVEAGAVEVDKRGRVIIRDGLRLDALAAGAPLPSPDRKTPPPSLLTPAVVGCMTGLRDEVLRLRVAVEVLTEHVLRSRPSHSDGAALDDLTVDLVRAFISPRHPDTRHQDTPPQGAG
jgi:hypothetical protein